MGEGFDVSQPNPRVAARVNTHYEPREIRT